MASMTARTFQPQIAHGIQAEMRHAARLLACTLAPLAAFGFANFLAESANVVPQFFSPLEMPGWGGAIIHLALLACVGLAYGLLRGGTQTVRGTRFWVAGFAAALVAFPFLAGPMDAFSLAASATVVTLVGIAATVRASQVSPLAGVLLAPALIWMGLAAALGLAIASAWTPPFALVTAQQASLPA